MTTTPISDPLAGERVVGLSPSNAAQAATDWPRRPNVFPGRALTAGALSQWQAWQGGHLAMRGQDWTGGIVDGLEVQAMAVEGSDFAATQLHVGRGRGLAVSGEDVVLQSAMQCLLADVPVVAPPGFFVDGSGVGLGTEGESPTLHPRQIGAALGALPPAALATLPPIGVLLLQPVTVDRSNLDPMDPCEHSACDEGSTGDAAAYEDWRIADGVRLLWYVWPGEWRGVPAVPAAQLRNALAWTVFQAEDALAASDALPWEEWGVPLALVALDGSRKPQWLDRATVVRQGGRAHDARLANAGDALIADSRKPGLWQARIEQLAEQIAAAGEPAPAASTLADEFARFLPPVGLLPKNAFEPGANRCGFFPPGFDLDAVPVPVEQLEIAVRANASLAPLNVSAAESVRLMVPVPLPSWEPRLLCHEVVDPLFQTVLDENLLRRARTLGLRQGLRNKQAMLSHALDGLTPDVPSWKDDPEAVEPESLSPWGEPPPGGGHRSALSSGVHQHFFDSANPTFEVKAGEALFAWAYLDPDHPPRTVMLQWHTADGGWEHRAYWGEDLIGWGTPNTASRLRAGNLPTPGEWVMLKVDAKLLGLEGKQLDGMAFTLFDGRAAYGLAGARTNFVWRKWFCNFLPTNAHVQGDEKWDLLTPNDLWAPFETLDGVLPSLPEVLADSTGVLGSGSGGTAKRAVPVSGFNLCYPPAAGWRGHVLVNPGLATMTTLASTDTLQTWVYLDELAPPRSLWVAVWCRVGQEPNQFATTIGYWGERRLDELYTAVPGYKAYDGVTARAGALPPSGSWVKLTLRRPANANPIQVFGIICMAFDGNMAFSDLLRVPADANQAPELVWPKSPTDTTTTPPYQPFLNAKLQPQHNLGVLTPTPSSRIGTVHVYTDLVSDPLIQKLSGHEQSQLLLRGLSGFSDYLRKRIDRADDITDFGFAHMQVDMYRLRNLTMSTTDATRLAISPTLAAIAKSDSAYVVQSQIKDYLSGVKSGLKPALAGLSGVSIAATSGTTMAAAASAPTTMAVSTVGSVTATAVRSASFRIGDTVGSLISRPKAPLPIVYADPVVGLSEIRTTAIADRLKNPPSPEARDYALANRHRTVSSLLDLLNAFSEEDSGETPALFDGFKIPGLPGDPFLALPEAHAQNNQVDLINFRTTSVLEALARPPSAAPGTLEAMSPDEGTLFTQAVSLSDSTVAILRQLEGRLTIYRDALGRCDAAVQQLRGEIDAMTSRLSTVGDDLAEARHDVSVARSLLAEETQRVNDINARRAAVLANEVKFIAYVRPREADNLLATPTHAVDPGLVEPAVPACLREHPDTPDELLDMLRVVREAPASWFVTLPPIIQRLDKIDHLVRLFSSAQARAVTGIAMPQLMLRMDTTDRIGAGIARVATRQIDALAPRLDMLRRLDVSVLAQTTWQGLRAQAEAVVSFGDLAEGGHGRADVTKAAAAELDNLRAVVSCLHAEFSGVLPIIRLQWAEMLSEFDDPPNLRNLASLPRWPEIAYLDRRRMQSYVDWLFAQVPAAQPQAIALINDVVRMCLLLASHAPVDRIVQGRLARPVSGAAIGTRIPLTVLNNNTLRIGMQALLYRNATLIGRALVEDLGQQEVSARLIHTSTERLELGDDVRVHFDDTAMVSLGTAIAKRSVFAR